MITRIQEIAEQAGIVNRKFAFDQPWIKNLTFEQQRFAELLAHEFVHWTNTNLGLVSHQAQADLFKHLGIPQ